MTVNKQKFPPCFGKIENVFPLGKNELREVPESCMFCYYKTDCMKTAMSGSEAVIIKQEIIDRAYFSGSLNFLQRWSRRKLLQKKRNNGKS